MQPARSWRRCSGWRHSEYTGPAPSPNPLPEGEGFKNGVPTRNFLLPLLLPGSEGEGSEGTFDSREDTLKGLEDLAVLEAKHGQTASVHEGISLQVAWRRGEMPGSVELDDQRCLGTEEIGDVRPEWVLAAKLRTSSGASAQGLPSHLLGGRCPASEVTSARG